MPRQLRHRARLHGGGDLHENVNPTRRPNCSPITALMTARPEPHPLDIALFSKTSDGRTGRTTSSAICVMAVTSIESRRSNDAPGYRQRGENIRIARARRCRFPCAVKWSFIKPDEKSPCISSAMPTNRSRAHSRIGTLFMKIRISCSRVFSSPVSPSTPGPLTSTSGANFPGRADPGTRDRGSAGAQFCRTKHARHRF